MKIHVNYSLDFVIGKRKFFVSIKIVNQCHKTIHLAIMTTEDGKNFANRQQD